jgi:hypothetical protein
MNDLYHLPTFPAAIDPRIYAASDEMSTKSRKIMFLESKAAAVA